MDSLQELIGEIVVVDVEALYVYAGTLSAVREKDIELRDADVHDLRDSATTREVYVLDTRVHGVRSNRRSVFVARSGIVSISRLNDVID